MQSFHSIQCNWPGARSLLIEWAAGKVGDQGPAPNIAGTSLVECTQELKPDDISVLSGVPAICWRADTERLFEPLQLRENTEYYVDISLPISLEQARARANTTGQWWPFTERLAEVFKRAPDRYWREQAGTTTVTGRLNFGSHVGIADLSVDGGRELCAEVACTKLGYFADFRDLLNDLSDQVITLLLQVDTSTGVRFQQSLATNTEPLVYLFHLRRVMARDALPVAVESILRDPHSLLNQERELVPPEHLRSVLPEAFVSNLPHMEFNVGGPLERLFRGHSPRRVPHERKTETFNTPENRYVKEFLQGLLHLVEKLRKNLRKSGHAASLREAERWSAQIDEWLSSPIWREVGHFTHLPSNSQVLQKRAGYSYVLEADLRIQVGISLPWNRGLELATATDGDVRPIYELYEYWCFFTLRNILRSLCGPEDSNSNELVKLSKHGIEIALKKGHQTALTFTPKAGVPAFKVHLFYNRRFGRQKASSQEWDGSYSAVFYPDCSILIETAQRTHWLHFDAKYRLDFQLWKDLTSNTLAKVEGELEAEAVQLSQEEDVNVYKLGDLYKMHTYRDALLGSRGAYILYPGISGTEEIFLRAPGRAYDITDVTIPSVGAFPLKPGGKTGTELLKKFLEGVLKTLAGGGDSYREEAGLFPESATEPTSTSQEG